MVKYQSRIDIAVIFYFCLLAMKEIYAEDDLKLRLVSTVML